jgi:hypothetical protein
MPRHLGALIPGDRSQQGCGQVGHPGCQRVVQGVAVTPGQVQQPDHPGLPFDQRADCRALVLADDEISLPVPGLRAVIGLEGPLADGEHRLLEPRAAPVATLMRPPVITPGAQRGAAMRGQRGRAHQRRSGLVDGLVDTLVTQPHPRRVREPPAQLLADLLRAPPLRSSSLST